MAELIARTAFSDGASDALDALEASGVRVRLSQPAVIASIAAFRDKAKKVADTIEAALGVTPPTSPCFSSLQPFTCWWVGPDGQWLLTTDSTGPSDLVAKLGRELDGLAAISDQTDAWAVLRLDGPRVFEILSEGVPVDLDARRFPPGGVACTRLAHLDIRLRHLHQPGGYELAVPRSNAGNLVGWLAHAVQR